MVSIMFENQALANGTGTIYKCLSRYETAAGISNGDSPRPSDGCLVPHVKWVLDSLFPGPQWTNKKQYPRKSVTWEVQPKRTKNSVFLTAPKSWEMLLEYRIETWTVTKDNTVVVSQCQCQLLDAITDNNLHIQITGETSSFSYMRLFTKLSTDLDSKICPWEVLERPL